MKKYTLIGVFTVLGALIFSFFSLSAVLASDCAPGDTYDSGTGRLCSEVRVSTSASMSAGGVSGNVSFNQELAFGSRGQYVKALQQFLKDNGYLSGRVDGIYGRLTRGAVTRYQVAANLAATGRADLETLARIRFLPTKCPIYMENGIMRYICPISSGSIVITRVSGPQTLSVNETGTWTVSAYDRSGESLSYSVVWGDEMTIYPMGTTGASAIAQQTATFTHSYSRAGTFTPVFKVTNTSGQSAETSISVNVGGVVNPNSPIISSLYPPSGPIGTRVTVYGSGFTATGNRVKFGSLGTEDNPNYNLNSADGVTFVFEVPSGNYLACWQAGCMAPAYTTQPGTYAVSVINANGTSNTVYFTVTSGTVSPSAPYISSITPSSGKVGTQVTLSGSGFASTNNSVKFGGGHLNGISSNGTYLTFVVPDGITPCPPDRNVCAEMYMRVTPGTYQVSVTNAYGSSNVVHFTVTSS